MEKQLARMLLSLPTVLQQAEETLNPHLLTSYLYELSKSFSQFYENCPVAGEKDAEVKRARVMLVTKTKGVIEVVMRDILGIRVLKRM